MKSQAQFSADMKMLDNILDGLIDKAVEMQNNVSEADELEQQNLGCAEDLR